MRRCICRTSCMHELSVGAMCSLPFKSNIHRVDSGARRDGSGSRNPALGWQIVYLSIDSVRIAERLL